MQLKISKFVGKCLCILARLSFKLFGSLSCTCQHWVCFWGYERQNSFECSSCPLKAFYHWYSSGGRRFICLGLDAEIYAEERQEGIKSPSWTGSNLSAWISKWPWKLIPTKICLSNPKLWSQLLKGHDSTVPVLQVERAFAADGGTVSLMASGTHRNVHSARGSVRQTHNC